MRLLILLFIFCGNFCFADDWVDFNISVASDNKLKMNDVTISLDTAKETPFKEDYIKFETKGKIFFIHATYGVGSYKIHKNLLLIKRNIGRGSTARTLILSVFDLEKDCPLCDITISQWVSHDTYKDFKVIEKVQKDEYKIDIFYDDAEFGRYVFKLKS